MYVTRQPSPPSPTLGVGMHEQQSTPQLAQNGFSRRAARRLSIQIQPHLNDSDFSTSSADSDKPPFARKNMKGLSLDTAPQREKPRRPSIVSLPAATLLHRRDEDTGSPVPYADGPVQVIPGIWIGSEDNARDWKALVERGIRSILNVAKEVSSPFDHAQGLRSAVSTPNFRNIQLQHPPSTSSHYYPPHVQSGRPGMHYLKLDWSHGQQDLVNHGFKEGMAFVDAALNRAEGCLIHCQCGISRSATMVIALVMRAAAERHAHVPPEVWALRGMQPAYDYVKLKSPCVGPNMSLIYSLLEYEKTFKRQKDPSSSSPHDSDTSSIADDEEEWTRRRRLLDDEGEGMDTSPEHSNHNDKPESDEKEREIESVIVMQEAKALDKAMEERIVARKSSTSSMSSIGSVSGSGSIFGVGIGIGIGSGTNSWRTRRHARKRTPSILSTRTTGSVSEDLVEEDEERDLLGIGDGFDNDTMSSSQQTEESSSSSSPGDVDVVMEDSEHRGTPRKDSGFGFPLWATTSRSSSTSRSTTSISRSTSSSPDPYPYPMPVTAIRSTFDLAPRLSPSPSPAPSLTKPKAKRRPASLALSLSSLPPVPASPVALVIENEDELEVGAMTAVPVTMSPAQPTAIPTIIPASKPIPAASFQPPPTPIRRRSESRIARTSSSLRQNVLLSSSLSSSSSSSTSLSTSMIGKGNFRRSSDSISTTPAGLIGGLMTPSQTLFVFPPSPTTASSTSTPTAMLNGPRTPSTMTLVSNPSFVPTSFTGMQTPRVSSSFGPPLGFGIVNDGCATTGSGNNDGVSSMGTTTTTSKAAKRRSWILTSTPPTVGLAKVDARGYIGFEVPLA